MSFDLSILTCLCVACLFFSYKKVKWWLWRTLIFIGAWLIGIVSAFSLGFWVGDTQGDKDIALNYLTQGFWLTFFGCIVGVFLSAKRKPDTEGHVSKKHDEPNIPIEKVKKSIISFGTDTLLKRCGLALIGVTSLLFLILCAYWNLTYKSFFYRSYQGQWHVAAIPKDDTKNSYFRFDKIRETYKLDRSCLEKAKDPMPKDHESKPDILDDLDVKLDTPKKKISTDIFRSQGIFAEECIVGVIQDQYESISTWKTSFEVFSKFLVKSSLAILLLISAAAGLVLFSGFADALAVWIKTGKWPQKTASQENFLKAKTVLRLLKRKTIATALIACFFVLALMFLEDWGNASAAYLETFLQVAAFALLLWIGKQCVKIIR